jgi:hypothetical protein
VFTIYASFDEVDENILKLEEKQYELKFAQFESNIALERFRKEHNINEFKWERFTTIFFFIVTMVLVLSGFVLAVLQFIASGILTKHKRKQGKQKDNEKQRDEIEISPNAVKIKTAYFGIMLLVLSFAFLFLYMYTAYPIKYLDEKINQHTYKEK